MSLGHSPKTLVNDFEPRALWILWDFINHSAKMFLNSRWNVVQMSLSPLTSINWDDTVKLMQCIRLYESPSCQSQKRVQRVLWMGWWALWLHIEEETTSRLSLHRSQMWAYINSWVQNSIEDWFYFLACPIDIAGSLIGPYGFLTSHVLVIWCDLLKKKIIIII